MPKSVLILTQPDDSHAYAVALALEAKGAEVTLWHTSDFPKSATESIVYEDGRQTVKIQGPGIDLDNPRFHTVWNRRPAWVTNGAILHPADREFAELGCKMFRKSFFDLLAPQAFWVNPYSSVIRGSKILQHRAALDVGLTTPDTIYTNDPAEIRKFIRRHGGRIAYKPLKALPWQDGDVAWMPYTSLLTNDELIDDEMLRAVPGIFQELVPKAYELRITMMGQRAFAAKILSQETQSGKLDWRKAYHELKMEPYELPEELAARCWNLMKKLRIVFGCFDFIATPNGEYTFLEVNQMGQFLFLEDYAGLQLVDAFSEFLLQGRDNFNWNVDKARVSYADIKSRVVDMIKEYSSIHVKPPLEVWREDDKPENTNVDPLRQGSGKC